MKYDFQCENGHIFEIDKKMTDPSPKKCPECGAIVRRIYNTVAFHGFGPFISDQAMREREKSGTELDCYDKKYGLTEDE